MTTRTLSEDEAKYKQVKDIVLSMISSGKMGAGDRIPSESEMISLYKVSKTTIRRALDELVLEGHLRRKQGTGTFVGDQVCVRNGKLVRQTGSIGIGIYDFQYLSLPYFSPIIQGIAEVAQKHNCSIQLVATNRETRPEFRSFYSQLLAEGKVDGLIVIDQIISDSDLLDLNRHGLPVVLLERSVPDAVFNSVKTDNRSAMVQVLEHLIHLGHQQIAFVCGSLEFLQSKERLDAYKSALKLFGMKYDPSLTIEWASESAAHPLDVLRTILDREHPPTGIITHNDTFALKLLKSLWTLRISVPQEISLVGFENASSMSVVIPTITSVDVRLKEMGREAGKILISALETGSDPGKNVVLQPKLVVRESTGVAPTAGPSVHDNR